MHLLALKGSFPPPGHPCRAAAVREALNARRQERDVILPALCGHGPFDMGATGVLDGQLEDSIPGSSVRSAIETISRGRGQVAPQSVDILGVLESRAEPQAVGAIFGTTPLS